ncbi:MAG TPA: DUF4342 domain-containing protein [Syntrophomonas sp.]|nr:DUF4342 domain-containing protein [Syntrophomonas sp.]
MGWKEKGSYFVEEVEMKLDDLGDQIKKLVKEGNARKLIIFKDNGDKLLEVPLTAGVAVGGVVAVAWPIIAAVVAVAGLMTHVKVQVVRKRDED